MFFTINQSFVYSLIVIVGIKRFSHLVIFSGFIVIKAIFEVISFGFLVFCLIRLYYQLLIQCFPFVFLNFVPLIFQQQPPLTAFLVPLIPNFALSLWIVLNVIKIMIDPLNFSFLFLTMINSYIWYVQSILIMLLFAFKFIVRYEYYYVDYRIVLRFYYYYFNSSFVNQIKLIWIFICVIKCILRIIIDILKYRWIIILIRLKLSDHNGFNEFC